MLQFIATNILMISLGAILVVVIRALPRINEEMLPSISRNILEKWIGSEIPSRIDEIVNGALEKFLRKVKVVLLRVDNSLTKSLKKIRHEENSNGKGIGLDFKEMTGDASKKNSDLTS